MRLQVIREVKTCRGCGQTKPLGMFGRNRREKDGKNILCRECIRERNTRRYAAIRQDPETYAAFLEDMRRRSEAYRRRNGAKKRVPAVVPEGMKRCPRCGCELEFAAFKGRGYCPSCAREHSHERWERIKANGWLHAIFKKQRRDVYKLKKLLGRNGKQGMDGRPTDAERPGHRG